jgi:hypothetical protein
MTLLPWNKPGAHQGGAGRDEKRRHAVRFPQQQIKKEIIFRS